MLQHTHSTSLRPQTTAHLAQTMSLLALSNGELSQKIEAELARNPALEVVEDPRCHICHRPLAYNGVCPACSANTCSNSEQPVVFISSRSEIRGSIGSNLEEDALGDEWLSAQVTLAEFVLQQIAADLDRQDRQLAVHIMTSVDDNGLLSVPPVEIAMYQHVPLARVLKVINLIQHAEPLGVASPTPKEALLVQLEALSEFGTVPLHAKAMIMNCMDLMSKKAYQEIARKIGISCHEAKATARFIIDNLYPYPARSNWDHTTSVRSNPAFIQPDILIRPQNNIENAPLIVEVFSPYAGGLRVNPLFKQAIRQAPAEKIEDWQESLDSATLLVKCLQQRNQALVRLMERLVVLQHRFIMGGDAEILPLTRAQLANELMVHESTISRAVSGKIVQLPNRHMIPLAKFFDRSLHIRTALREIINSEPSPYSDTQLAEMLKKEGYPVARRTVAKYRAMEGILPSKYRKPALIS